VKPNASDLKASAKVIGTQVKAYIARNIIGEAGFYPIIRTIDKTLQEAIKDSRIPIRQKLPAVVTK
jgi:carboxyl-terminal processing protease